MTLIPVTLETIKDLDDGRVAAAFALELKRAVNDCMDRPGDANARNVYLECKLTPVIGDDGQCEGANGEFQIKSKVPTRKSKTYSFGLNKKGFLYFSDESPDNVNQTTIHEMDASGRVRRNGAD